VSIKTWWKQHFTLGIILSGATGSLVCTIFVEAIWPNTLPFLRPITTKLGGWISALWAWITGNASVPRWWYALLLLYAVGTSLRAVALWVKTKLAPSWREYALDTFKGMRWRWNLSAYHGDIESIAPYCLRCDRQLISGRGTFNREGFDAIRNTLDCRHHGHQYDFRGDISEVIAEVEEEIRLKLRNGTWEEVVRQLPRNRD